MNERFSDDFWIGYVTSRKMGFVADSKISMMDYCVNWGEILEQMIGETIELELSSKMNGNEWK
jgi:hypothetical protein